jgi:hypothetical protein
MVVVVDVVLLVLVVVVVSGIVVLVEGTIVVVVVVVGGTVVVVEVVVTGTSVVVVPTGTKTITGTVIGSIKIVVLVVLVDVVDVEDVLGDVLEVEEDNPLVGLSKTSGTVTAKTTEETTTVDDKDVTGRLTVITGRLVVDVLDVEDISNPDFGSDVVTLVVEDNGTLPATVVSTRRLKTKPLTL